MESHKMQDSQDAERPPIPVVNGEAKKSNGKKKKILLSFAGVVLLVGLGSTGYLYSQEKSDNKELNSQVNVLDSEIETLKQQEAAEEASEVEPAQEVPEQTVYKAKVGKFTLTLPSKYYVIEELDGGFEGGPATQIKVATSEKQGVVNNPITANLSISAGLTELLQQDFDKYIENKLKEHPSYEKTDSIKIDGQDAQVYEVDGLLSQKNIFFQNKDGKIHYEITVVDGSEKFNGTKELLEDTVKGFKFN